MKFHRPAPPLTRQELIAMWRSSAEDSPLRRALLEIARQDHLLVQAHEMAQIIRKDYHELVGGHLVAVHQLRTLLADERAIVNRKYSIPRRAVEADE